MSRQSRNESTVPNASRPCSGRRARTAHIVEQPGDLGRREIRIEHAGRSFPLTAGSCPAARNAAQASAVRRSCQTMALWIGLPVARSQTIVVSRWLVMPMPAMSLGSDASLRHRFPHGRDHSRPDVLRIVLDPSRRRINLPQLLLRNGDRGKLCIEHDRPCRGGALIDGDEVGHLLRGREFGFGCRVTFERRRSLAEGEGLPSTT